MEIDTPRSQSMFTSTNNSRASLIHSNISSIVYAECVQTLTNNPTWTNQVELRESEEPTLFYVPLKVGETESVNQANMTELWPESHNIVLNDIFVPQGLELSAISYSANQSVDP